MEMTFTLIVALCLFQSTLGIWDDKLDYVLEHEVIKGKKESGVWDDHLLCTHGVRVTGFRLRVTPQGVSGIQLACSDGTETYQSDGKVGEWKNFKYCDGEMMLWASKYVNGFKFRSDKNGGQDVDMLCNEGTQLNGEGKDVGTWDSTDYGKCEEGTYFCGVQKRGDDKTVNQLSFLCCKPKKDVIITETITLGKTDFGVWSKVIMCENSGQVSGFRLQVEEELGAGGDDSGLNGIQLLCKDGTATQKIEGPFGSWKSWQFCDTKTDYAFYQYVTGFNLRSEKSQYKEDDSAANNVKFKCRNGREIDGQGNSYGTWDSDDYQVCPFESFLCGVQAKTEWNQHAKDDTAINKLKFICCKVENEKCPIKVEPMGCFGDSRSDRTMPIEILNERDASNSNFKGTHYIDWWNYPTYLPAFRCRCAMEAAKRGYKMFGIQFYAECWSGPDTQLDFDKHGDASNCVDTKYKTKQHELQACPVQTGVANSNMVYRIASEDSTCDIGFAPVGCFEDFMDIPRPVPNYKHNERDDTIDGFNGIYIDWKDWNNYYKKMICRCAQAAKKLKHEIFSIQYWGECWTSFRNETEFDRDGPSTRCRGKDFKPCPCNSFHCVGMHQANYVYQMTV